MDALPQYSQVGIPAECIEKVSEYVNSRDLAAQPCGKYEIDGEQIYVSIQEYETKSYMDCRFETHKRLNWNPSFQFASLSSDLANRLHK